MTLGMKRLGIALGLLGSISWVAYVADASQKFTVLGPHGLEVLIVGIPVVFGVVFLVVWTIDWIIAGFRADKERSPESARGNL
jgi:hypothetical protein